MKKPRSYALAVWIAMLVSLGFTSIAEAQHFQYTPTETGHSILIDNAIINGYPLEPGDEIGVFTPGPDAICAGAVVFDGYPIGITAWGDDPNTPEVDGFTQDDDLYYRFYRDNSEAELGANTFDVEGPDTWTPDGISTLNLWAVDDAGGQAVHTKYVDVIDFGTIGDHGQGTRNERQGALINTGNAPLVVLYGDAVNESVQSDDFGFPYFLQPDEVFVFTVYCQGDSPFEDEFIVETNEGPVSFDVRADVFPDGATCHYDEPPATCENFSLIIEGYELNGTSPMRGDEIAVYGEDSGYIAGVTCVDIDEDGQPIGVTVWGDDPDTPEVDGLVPGENMCVEVSRPATNWWDITMIAEWQGFDGSYITDGDGSATCIGEMLEIMGEVIEGPTEMDFRWTKNGYTDLTYGFIANNSSTGWIVIENDGGTPENVFDSDLSFWLWEGGLQVPPGATVVTTHRFTPTESGEHTGSTSHKWVATENGIYVVQGNGASDDEWYHFMGNTGTNHSIIVDHAWINGWPVEPGDEVGISCNDSDDDGHYYGAETFHCEFPMGIAAWGDDPTTPEVDGLVQGDEMCFRVYDHSEGIDYMAWPEVLDGSLEWTPDGITVIQLHTIPIPWHLEVFSDQCKDENDSFDDVLLDDAIGFGPDLSNWGPGPGVSLDEVDPDSISWTYGFVTPGPRDMDLLVDISETRVLTVAVPDSEWVGTQTIRLYCEDQYGQQDSTDLVYEVLQVNDPPSAFNLISLSDGEIIDYQDPTLTWHSTSDVDWSDQEVTYVLQWGIIPDWWANPSEDTGTDTTFQFTEEAILALYKDWKEQTQLDDLIGDELTILWRVVALDSDNGQTVSGPDDYWTFSVHINDPPSTFDLLSPADAETLEFVDLPVYNFSWEESVDPDPDAPDVVYNLYIDVPDFAPYMVVVEGTNEDVNFYDDLSLDPWIGYLDFSWWVEAISEGDTVTCTEAFDVTVESTSGVGQEIFGGIPSSYRIESVYPNPFNPTTNVVVGLVEPGMLKVEVFNMLGQRVGILAESAFEAGYHKFIFDGNGHASGLYFVHAVVPGKMDEIRRIILIR